MPEKVFQQIKYLCKAIAKVEWSGVLFYTVQGTISDPANMVITLQDIYPMQKGTATYTEYDFGDPQFIKHMMANPTLLQARLAHIHSHNTMGKQFVSTN